MKIKFGIFWPLVIATMAGSLGGCFPDVDRTKIGLGQLCQTSAECANYEQANFCTNDLMSMMGIAPGLLGSALRDTEQDTGAPPTTEMGFCTIKDCQPGNCPTYYQCCVCEIAGGLFPAPPNTCVGDDFVDSLTAELQAYGVTCSCS